MLSLPCHARAEIPDAQGDSYEFYGRDLVSHVLPEAQRPSGPIGLSSHHPNILTGVNQSAEEDAMRSVTEWLLLPGRIVLLEAKNMN